MPLRRSIIDFLQYTTGLIETRRAEKEAFLSKLRPHINRALAAKKELKSYHNFASADRIMANEKSWRQSSEEDRRTIFEEYITKLRQKEAVSKGHNLGATLTFARMRSASFRDVTLPCFPIWSSHSILMLPPAGVPRTK